jgi:hypothetical protein
MYRLRALEYTRCRDLSDLKINIGFIVNAKCACKRK